MDRISWSLRGAVLFVYDDSGIIESVCVTKCCFQNSSCQSPVNRKDLKAILLLRDLEGLCGNLDSRHVILLNHIEIGFALFFRCGQERGAHATGELKSKLRQSGHGQGFFLGVDKECGCFDFYSYLYGVFGYKLWFL